MRGVIAKLRASFRSFYRVPWCVPDIDREQVLFVVRTLLTWRIRAGSGSEEQQLVDNLKDFLGLPYVLPVNRGRTAIELAIRGLGLGPGDEVIVPSYLCTTALDGVTASGATPVFADVNERLHLTPETVRSALTDRTRCILVAHLYGETAPIRAIELLAQDLDIHLIDDAAQSLGALHEGRPVGAFGSVGIVSSGPAKSLSGPAGGALVTARREVHDRAAAISLPDEPTTQVIKRVLGFLFWRRARRFSLPVELALRAVTPPWPEPTHQSARLSNLDAGIMRRQLDRVHEGAKRRKRNAVLAARHLRAVGATILNEDGPDGVAVKLVAILPEQGLKRDAVIEAYARAGVEAQGWYTPLHLIAKGSSGPELPQVESLWKRVVCFPLEGSWDQITDPGLQELSTLDSPKQF